MKRSQRRYRRQGAADNQKEFEQQTSEEQLDTLEHLIEEARASTYEAVYSHHRDFLSIQLYGHDPLDEVATLNDKYDIARTSATDALSSVDLERLDTVGRALRAVVRLARAHASLKEVDDQILHGDVAIAASSIAEATTLLLELEDDVPRLIDLELLQILQSQNVKKRAALKSELGYLMDQMYRVSGSSDVYELTVSYCIMSNYDDVPYENPVTLSDLFFALTELGVDKEKADTLISLLIDRWLAPLLRNPHDTVSVSRTKLFATMSIGAFTATSTNSKQESKSLQVAASSRSDMEHYCATLREKWEIVLGFVRDEMFHEVNVEEDHADLFAYMGGQLWTTLWPLVREGLLVPLVPADIDDISDTQCMAPLMELEEVWLNTGLITADSMFVRESIRSLLQTYVSKRRYDLLTTVATILASEDANTVTVGGDGPVIDLLCEYTSGGKKEEKGSQKAAKGFTMGEDDDGGSLTFMRCSISVQAQTLVEFARETIEFTKTGDEKTAALYFHAVRDAFSLYRCLVPCRWATELLVDPKRAFVMHNDCEFICHHLSTLGYRLRDHWPPTLKASATFIDLIAAYRALARSSLTPMLNRVRDQITQALGSWTEPYWLSSKLGNVDCDIGALAGDAAGDLDHAENNLTVACGTIGQISHVSSAHLSRDMHSKVLGILCDVVIAHVAQRLEETKNISDSAARELVRLAGPVLSLEGRFTSNVLHGRKAPVAKFSQEWDRLQKEIRRLSSISAQHAPEDIEVLQEQTFKH
ncbi:ribosome biogenesis protein ytm1 [Coemansia guatemalensis]|uniref:Ribosome biogenesis protein ytm1 n=1 Tax=Coemansia guatemalensis TaxID=2761395 RepID=A0A9W8HVJ2_9FUNG|nr:ribosome biogenesis protein ytm1 [Coemansia guatemalensis]